MGERLDPSELWMAAQWRRWVATRVWGQQHLSCTMFRDILKKPKTLEARRKWTGTRHYYRPWLLFVVRADFTDLPLWVVDLTGAH